MKIAFDYDGMFTLDPTMWIKVMEAIKASNHSIYLVTMRYDTPQEADEVRANLPEELITEFVFTGRMSKQPFMSSKGIKIDVWIDNNPFWILNNW